MSNEDYEMLADENRRMARLLTTLGLSKEGLDDLCYGGEVAILHAQRLIEGNIVSRVKDKLSNMDSDQVFDFTYSDEGLNNET